MVSLQAGGRPPLVVFESRSVEDRPQTEATGSKKFKTENIAVIRQSGSKDCSERNAEEWLESIKTNPSYEPMWVERFQSNFRLFLSGQEITPDGTHVRMWAAIDKGQVDTLIAAGVLTVEDLAAANEDTLRRIGIGNRAMQDKAKAWLKSAADVGKSAEANLAMKARLEMQDLQIQNLQNQIRELLEALPKGKAKPAEKDDFLDNAA